MKMTEVVKRVFLISHHLITQGDQIVAWILNYVMVKILVIISLIGRTHHHLVEWSCLNIITLDGRVLSDCLVADNIEELLI